MLLYVVVLVGTGYYCAATVLFMGGILDKATLIRCWVINDAVIQVVLSCRERDTGWMRPRSAAIGLAMLWQWLALATTALLLCRERDTG